MSLKLPLFTDVRRTLAAWRSELTSAGIVATGRTASVVVPQFDQNKGDWTTKTPETLGKGYQDFNVQFDMPDIVINNSFCRYQIFGNMLHFVMWANITFSGAGTFPLSLRLPVRLNDIPYVGVGFLPQLQLGSGWYTNVTTSSDDGYLLVRANYTMPDYVELRIPSGSFPGGDQFLLSCNILCEVLNG